MTADEADAMLDDAAAVLSGENIDEAHDNKYEFGENVKVIPQTATVTIDADYTVTVSDYDCDISSGDIFVAYSAGIPVALKAVAIESCDNVTTITATQDGTENVVTSVDSEGVAEFDLENFETEDVETYSITDIETHETSEMQISLQSISYDKKAKKLTATKDVKISGSTSGSITVEVSDLKLYHKENTTSGDYMAYIQGNTSVTKSISFDLGNYLEVPSSITLGYINIGGVGNVSLDIDIALKGGMSANETGVITAGFSYARNDGFRLIKGYKKTAYSFTAEAEVKVGLTLSANIDLVVMNGRIWATVGVKGYFKFKDYTYVDGERPLQCKTIGGFLYANVGASASINYFIDKKSWSKTVDIYTESNSPIRVYYHYEDNQLVDRCTRGKDNNEAYIKYTTHTNSAYFNPSPSYGQGSYTGGDGTTITLWTYENYGENATITGYKGNSSVVAIPVKIDGYTVTAIENSAFENNKIFHAVTIPNTVKKIGQKAFYNCVNLKQIILLDSLSEIKEYTFQNCEELNNVKIPESVTTISTSAFSNCSSLETVKLPSNLRELGQYAFWGCKKLQNIFIPKNLKTVSNSSVFGDCTSLKYAEIEDGMATIPNYLFQNCSALTDVKIPESVTAIGTSDFYSCSNLETVKLPSNLRELGQYAFWGCKKLQSIFIPKTLKTVSDRGVFGDCISLKYAEIEDGMATIPNYLFQNCSALTEVKIPESVTTIGTSAFYSCSNLETVKLPSNLRELGEDVFGGCKKLQSIIIPKTLKTVSTWGVFGNCTSLKYAEIEDGMEIMPDTLFKNCTALKTVKLPNSIICIGSSTFSGCKSLKNISIPTGLKEIKESAFANNILLKTIKLPASVNIVAANSFYGCDQIILDCENDYVADYAKSKNISYIKDSVLYEKDETANGEQTSGTYYSEYGIYFDELSNTVTGYDRKLKKVEIPEYLGEEPVLYISETAFQNSNNLEEIVLPNSVQTIENYSFANCLNLQHITLPENLTKIGYQAFSDCYSLEEIVLPAEVSETGFYYHAGSYSYGNWFNNCYNLKRVTIEDGAALIPQYAFADTPALEEIVLPNSIKTIGNYSFAKCLNLQHITLPENLTKIGYQAFSDCYSLEEIVLPAEVSETGFDKPSGSYYYGNWFNNCYNLKRITIEDGAALIPQYAFAGAPALEEIVLPNSVKTIEDSALSKNEQLKSVYYSGNKKQWNDMNIKNGNTSLDNAVIYYNSKNKIIKVTEVAVENKLVRLNVGNKYAINYSVMPLNATDNTVNWNSSNTAVAEVTNGIVYAKSKGEAVISVKTIDGGYSTDFVVKVCDGDAYITNDAEIKFDKRNIDITIGDFCLINTQLEPTNSSYKNLKWSSSDNNVISVENGVIYAKGIGSADVTAESHSGYKASCRVNVLQNSDIVPVTGVLLDKSEATIFEGDTMKLIAHILPVNATNKAVRWKSSNESVAEVNNGVISAKSLGSAIITVQTIDGSYSATCKVNVVPKIEITSFTCNNMNGFGLIDISTVNVPEYATVYMSAYDKNGKLLSVEKITLSNGAAQTIIPLTNVFKLKAFIWEANIIKPLTEAKEITVQ